MAVDLPAQQIAGMERIDIAAHGILPTRLRPGRRGLLAALAVLLAAAWIVAATARAEVDYPLIRLLNRGARVVPVLDKALVWLTAEYLMSGVVFMSLVWGCWFAAGAAGRRGMILSGTVAAFLSGMASRVLQLSLPTHARPMHDLALGMVLPVSVDPSRLNHWSSFPSDHAAVQFGLATVVLLEWRRLGIAALAWAVLQNGARVYLGVHFPTDVLGGAALGVMVVLLAQQPAARRAGAWVASLEHRGRGWFYMAAFFISYQIATLFDEVREAAAAALTMLHHGGGGF